MTLSEIAFDAGRYPVEWIAGCEDALLLFGAGFLGRNDGYWVHRLGIPATVVDLDAAKLDAMREIYPGWRWVCADVFDVLHYGTLSADLVSVDPPSNHVAGCLDELPNICRLARKVVVLGVTGDTLKGRSNILRHVDPAWESEGLLKRSDRFGVTSWLTLRRR